MATRPQLKHAIRASCEIISQPGVIVIGSQAILATWSDDELPYVATRSDELDICPLRDDDSASLAMALAGAAGEWSLFHETHGFYIDGVGLKTPVLPGGFEERLVAVSDEDTRGYVGYCLDPHDLCVAKLAANRDKDREFVGSLVEHRIVGPRVIDERLCWTALDDVRLAASRSFLAEHVQRWNILDIVPEEPSDSLGKDLQLPCLPQVLEASTEPTREP